MDLSQKNVERFWSCIDRTNPDGCWPWLRQIKPNGYGRFDVWLPLPLSKKKRYNAHRVAYQLTYGPILDGFDIDHECHNQTDCTKVYDCPHRRCCNPSHLVAKTRSANLKAGNTSGKKGHRVTHCNFGHEYNEENSYISPDGRNRICRKCNNRRQRETKRRRILGLYTPSHRIGHPKSKKEGQ